MQGSEDSKQLGLDLDKATRLWRSTRSICWSNEIYAESENEDIEEYRQTLSIGNVISVCLGCT